MAEIVLGAIIGIAIYTLIGLLINALQHKATPFSEDEMEFLREW